MADTTKLEQMLEKLVNNDRDGADQLFHEFVIEKSRSIYEKMIESDLEDLEVDEATDEEVDEATDDEDLEESDDEEVDENFDEFTPEADPMGGEPGPDMLKDIEADGDDEDGVMDMGDEGEEGEEELEDRVVDLEDALDDLKAEFEKMMSGEEGDMDDEGDEDGDEMDMDDEGDEEAEEESYDPSTLGMPAYEGKKSQAEQMREYVEKVAAPKGEDNKAKSPVAGKNDMGGTTANIAKGSAEEKGGSVSTPNVEDFNQVNVSGNKKAPAMSNAKGHGAEKKGAGETGTNSKSTIGS